MPRVYFPQQPSRFDRPSGLWVPTVNIEPAKKFGVVEVMLPPEASRLPTETLVKKMREKLVEFTEDDFIAATGSPTIIAIAAILAARRTDGILNMLTWDRRLEDYIASEIVV